MKRTSVFKPVSVLITSLVLIICAPQAFARGGGHGGGGFGGGGFHGGGGGFHGGGGGFHGGGGGFHGGGGGFHGGGGGFHGGGGWHSGGYGGWHGGGYGWGGHGWGGHGWGGNGWGGWGSGWGWGFGAGFGWGLGWGSYWGGYPYAYPYPYYYYPNPYYYSYDPYYYDGPYSSARQAPGPYNANTGGDWQQQDTSIHETDNRPASLVTTKATTPRPPVSSRSASNAGASYRTASFAGQQLAGLRPQARNVMQALLAMPPAARRRQVESGRYSSFSPEEQELFRKAAQLPAYLTAPNKNEGRAKGQLILARKPATVPAPAQP